MIKMPYLYLMAVKKELAEAFLFSFADTDGVEIIQEEFSIFMDKHPETDGIVSPANAFGMLTGGFDRAIRDYFGIELQNNVRNKIMTEWFGEQTVGTSIAIDIPGYPDKKLFHTPTMRTPSQITDFQMVYLCMRSALMAAIEAEVNYLLVPAFGGGAGKIPETIIAKNMRSAYDQIHEQISNPHTEMFRTAKRIIRYADS